MKALLPLLALVLALTTKPVAAAPQFDPREVTISCKLISPGPHGGANSLRPPEITTRVGQTCGMEMKGIHATVSTLDYKIRPSLLVENKVAFTFRVGNLGGKPVNQAYSGIAVLGQEYPVNVGRHQFTLTFREGR